MRNLTAALALACCASHDVHAQRGPTNQVTPGDLIVEHPTLINLGFEWMIDGDANRNASVDVTFRKQGDTAWRKALPLLRLQGEQTYSANTWNLVAPNAFMGSILDLEPDTTYEVRMVMSDPDGVSNQQSAIGNQEGATRTVTVRTRPEPMPADGGKTYHVYPTKWRRLSGRGDA